MSESDTMFNERDRRCATLQLMLSTDPSYDNSTIASTLKIQIWIAMNNRDVSRVMKTNCCRLLKSAWKSTLKCTWMYWRVWWSPGAIRWPVADPGCGSRTQCRPTSPERPRSWLQNECYDFVPFSHWPPSSPTWTHWTTSFGPYVENITNMTSHNTKASLIAAIRRVFAELPLALVERACSQFQIPFEAVIEAEGSYIELMSAQLHNQVTWIDFFNKSFKIKL